MPPLFLFSGGANSVKCLVTGASGFIGTALCQQLESQGHEVLALCGRGDLDFAVESVSDTLLEGVDWVFHCAAIAHRKARVEDYERVNTQAVLTLARQCQAASVRAFVFLSSVKASDRDDPYGASKHRAERALEVEFATASMVVTILRPALVYGALVKGNLAFLLRGVRAGLPQPPSRGARSMVSVGDLVAALLLAAARSSGSVVIYSVCDGQRYSFQRLYQALRRALDRPAATWSLPLWCWRVLGRKRFDTLFSEECCSNDKLCRELGWQALDSFESVAAAMVAAESGQR